MSNDRKPASRDLFSDEGYNTAEIGLSNAKLQEIVKLTDLARPGGGLDCTSHRGPFLRGKRSAGVANPELWRSRRGHSEPGGHAAVTAVPLAPQHLKSSPSAPAPPADLNCSAARPGSQSLVSPLLEIPLGERNLLVVIPYLTDVH